MMGRNIVGHRRWCDPIAGLSVALYVLIGMDYIRASGCMEVNHLTGVTNNRKQLCCLNF